MFKHLKKNKSNIEIANNLHEWVNFMFEKCWLIWEKMKKKCVLVYSDWSLVGVVIFLFAWLDQYLSRAIACSSKEMF